MDKLMECAVVYEELLGFQYTMVIGRKGKTKKIELTFVKEDFHHLIGLHKLKDIEILRSGKRDKIFDQIIKGNIPLSKIRKSSFYGEMSDRLEPFTHIKDFLDSNDLIIKYDEKRNKYSIIRADYLLTGGIDGTEVYLFLDQEAERHFCRTFFSKKGMDYTINQTRFTLLKKTKINTVTGEQRVLYCNPNYRETE